MAAAEGGSGGKGPRRAAGGQGPKRAAATPAARTRPSSIRAAAETAAGSASRSAKPSRPAKASRPAKTATSTKAARSTKPSKPAERARAKASRPAAASPLSIDPLDSGIIEVTPPPAPVEPEIPDLPPPDVPESGEGFPDYEVRSDTWDPWSEEEGEPGRTDPDFDAQRTLGQWLEGVIPPDAQMHFINAGREFAQGVQVTVDHHTGKRRGPNGDRPGGPSRIEIE